MQTRMQYHFRQHADLSKISYSSEQLQCLQIAAEEEATLALLASMEQRMLDADIAEVEGTIATLESLQTCLTAVQAQPDRTALQAIERAINVQYARVGIAPMAIAMEALTDTELTASMEAGLWDAIKRMWAALIDMCKRLVTYIAELFNGNRAKQKAAEAKIAAAWDDIKAATDAQFEDIASTEDMHTATSYGILVSASAGVKDALNVAPRTGKTDVPALLQDGIADLRTLTQIKDKLFRGVGLLEEFKKGEQSHLEAALDTYTESLYTGALNGFRGPKAEGKVVHYHSKWTHPLGGLMLVVTPAEEGTIKPLGHMWAANVKFSRVVNSMVVKPYRDAPLDDKEGASLRMSKPDILKFFADIREFTKAAGSYNAIYNTLFESFNSRQVTVAKQFETMSEGDEVAALRNRNACTFSTQLVRLAQQYAKVAVGASNAHTTVLGAAAQLARSLSDKITQK